MSKDFKHILVPTDGTEFCEQAVRHAAQLAKALGAKLSIVTVVKPIRPQVTATIPADLQQEIATRSQRDTEDLLARSTKLAAEAGVASTTATAHHEQIWQGIIDQAERLGADLIAMASHGRRGLSAILLGSETHKVVTHTSLPVLVYRS